VAVEVPGACAAADDGLEGAESAFGRGAVAAEVDGDGFGFLAGHGLAAGEEGAGAGGSGACDPDGVESVFQPRVGVGEVDVVFGHSLGDLAEVALDVREVRAVAQQVGCERVPGLVGDAVAEVELVDPAAEQRVEPAVADALAGVEVGLLPWEERQGRAFVIGGWSAVEFEEPGDGLGLASFDPLVQPFGNADGLVEVADLGLVVPEHREPTESADAFQPQLQDFAGAPAGEDQRFPDVAQAAVVWVEAVQELQVGLVRESLGDGVGKRAAASTVTAAVGQGDDEGAVQADALGGAGLQAARRTRRAPLNTAAILGLVTVVSSPSPPARPPWGRMASAGRPCSARCRWSATKAFMWAAISTVGSWPPPGAWAWR
jgi:hypothetical protein